MPKAEERYDSKYHGRGGKDDIGAYVYLLGGARFLFDKTAKWRWVTIDGESFIEVEEGGQVAFQAPRGHVLCVGGDMVLVRDAFWKK